MLQCFVMFVSNKSSSQHASCYSALSLKKLGEPCPTIPTTHSFDIRACKTFYADLKTFCSSLQNQQPLSYELMYSPVITDQSVFAKD